MTPTAVVAPGNGAKQQAEQTKGGFKGCYLVSGDQRCCFPSKHTKVEGVGGSVVSVLCKRAF